MIHTVDFKDNILHKVCKPVTDIKTQVHPYAKAAYKNLISQPTGVALSANQLGLSYRWYIDLAERIYINPVILEKSEPIQVEEECLSIPDFNTTVERFNKVTLEFVDVLEKHHAIKLQGLQAWVAQHEIEHLKGKLIND